MVSLFRPNLFSIPRVEIQQNQPEGVPFIRQSNSQWFITINLPDVKEEDFHYDIDKDNNLIISWSDCKQLKYQGRLYESRKEFKKSISLPEGISLEDIQSSFENQKAIITIQKPKQDLKQQDDQQLNDNSKYLMKIPIPQGDDYQVNMEIQNDQLFITYECKVEKENSWCVSKIQRKTHLPVAGLTKSNINWKVENGYLLVIHSESEHIVDDQQQIECNSNDLHVNNDQQSIE